MRKDRVNSIALLVLTLGLYQSAAAMAAKEIHTEKNEERSMPPLSGGAAEAISIYASKVRNVIDQSLGDTTPYRGKICTVRIEIVRNGNINEIIDVKGDTLLCNKVVRVLNNVHLPPPDNDELYEKFQRFVLDFKL